MSETSAAVATTWARALVQAAGSDAVPVLDALRGLIQSIDANPDTWDRLVSPVTPQSAQHAAIKTLAASAPPAAANLLALLVERRRLADLPAIVDAYAKLVAAMRDELDVQVTTAIELDDTLRGEIEKRLSASTGATVRLHASLDPEIIGGLVLQYGDTRIDASVRGRLDNLRSMLRTATSN